MRELAWYKNVTKNKARFLVGAAQEREACRIQDKADVLSDIA